MRTTQSILVSAALFVANAAFAGTVFETVVADHTSDTRHIKAELRANIENPELSRAWITTYYVDSTIQDSDGPLPKAEDISVPGLTYSHSANEIMYKSTVCATRAGSKFVPTGRCEILVSKADLVQDSGFKVKKSPGLKVSFNVKQ
ncbi:MAG: hypothetical protein ACM3MG_06010 [Bacillota bacterium]